MARKKRRRRKLQIWNAVLLVLVVGCFCLLKSMAAPVEPEETVPAAAEPATEATVAEETEPAFDKNDPILILVNKENYLDPDYVPDDLVTLSSSISIKSDMKMQSEAAAALEELFDGASADGLTIKAVSSYRSYSYQKDLYNYYLSTHGQEWTEKYSAPPGASEHQTGLAVDVSCASMGYGLDSSFGQTTEGIWIRDHVHEYGFILRYQEGKEDITGYAYEPWHIRYVGEEAATEIYNNEITLEEFLGDI